MIAIYFTMYHVWFLEYKRVLPQPRLHLPRHHLHHRSQHRPTVIQYRRTEMWRLQYSKGEEVWMRSYGETLCMIPQKPWNKMKIGNPKKYKEISRMTCLIGYRNFWENLMKVLPKSVGRDLMQRSAHTSSSSHVFLWSREHTCTRVLVSTVYLHTFRRIRIVKCAWRPK